MGTGMGVCRLHALGVSHKGAGSYPFIMITVRHELEPLLRVASREGSHIIASPSLCSR